MKIDAEVGLDDAVRAVEDAKERAALAQRPWSDWRVTFNKASVDDDDAAEALGPAACPFCGGDGDGVDDVEDIGLFGDAIVALIAGEAGLARSLFARCLADRPAAEVERAFAMAGIRRAA